MEQQLFHPEMIAMKTLLFGIMLGLASTGSIAQLVRPALDSDPVFHRVLFKRIEYPRNAILYSHVYGRVYAGFHIDEKGKLTNLTILSPGNTKSGFEYEVVQALKHMPSLDPRYQGDYALPVAFRFINRDQSSRLYSPVNKLEEKYLTNRLLLNEWHCTFSVSSKYGPGADPKEVWGFYAKN